MIKEFLMKKMLKSKGVSDDQIEQVMGMMNNNPELFQKILLEVQEKVKQGGDQMQVTMEVMMKYQKEIAEAMQKKN